MKSPKILILTALIIALIAIPITATKQADANTSQNKPVEDDILYLRRSPQPPSGSNLTISGPDSATAATITVTIPPGGKSAQGTARWVNMTTVPSGYNWSIPAQQYNFTFWMSRIKTPDSVNVTFTFGYIDANGIPWGIVTGSKTVTGLPAEITKYNITVTPVSGATISSGSKLFLRVNITVSGGPGDGVTFYYDGTSQPTQIKTPTISAVVPEFPFGIVLLPYALFLAYFALRKRSVRFRV